MDEQTAKHLVKIMEDIQKDVHVIASNKEVLNDVQNLNKEFQLFKQKAERNFIENAMKN